MKLPQSANRPVTELDYRQRINQATVFMRERLHLPPTINEVAASAHFSPFHFHRIFKAFTGETVGDYFQRIRMTEAAALIGKGLSTTQVATRVGYQTASSFIQEFKKVFQMVPSVFRQHHTSLVQPVFRPGPGDQHISHTNTPPPVFQEMPPLHLILISKKATVTQDFTGIAGPAFDQLHQWLARRQLMSHVISRLGILRELDLTSSLYQRFDACAAIPGHLVPVISRPVEKGFIPGGAYAVFLHTGPYNTLWQTWNRIYQSWYPSSGVRLADQPPFEIYLNNRRDTDASQLVTEIHIPVS